MTGRKRVLVTDREGGGHVTDLSEFCQDASQGFVLVLRDVTYDVWGEVGSNSVGIQHRC